MKKTYIILCLICITFAQPLFAKRDLGISLSMANDGWRNELVFLPSFVYQNEYIVSQLGFGFSQSEFTENTSTQSDESNPESISSTKTVTKNKYNPITLSLAFKLNLNESLTGLYGLRITSLSGKFNNIRIENSSKISLTAGFLKAISKNFYFSSMLDIYSTYTYEWNPSDLQSSDMSGKTFLSGGRFSFIYTF